MIVQVKLRGAQQILRGLERVQTVIERGSVDGLGRRLAREGLVIVRKLTPRQQNTLRAPSTRRMPAGSPPLWRRWDILERKVSDSRYSAIIRNRARLNPQGAVILAALEFGARAHPIPASGLRRMVWDQAGSFRLFRGRATDPNQNIVDLFEDRAQEEGPVVAMRVHHPGHEAFRMVHRTKEHLRSFSGILLHAFARDIREAFASGFRIRIV